MQRPRLSSLSAIVSVTAITAVATIGFIPRTARANPEPVAIYDARAMALGGAMSALVDGPAAIYHNPAGLAHIDRMELNATFTPFITQLRAPLVNDQASESTGWVFAPLAFLGGAGRIADDLNIGFGAYLSTAFGGDYTNLDRIGYCNMEAGAQAPSADTCFDPADPFNERVVFVLFEAAVPVSYRVSDTLRLGASLRIPFGYQSTSTHQPALGDWNLAEQKVFGSGLPGGMFGVQWDAIPELTLSLVYRTHITAKMRGDITTVFFGSEPDTVGASTEWTVPHMLRFGAAGRFLDDHLRFAGDFRLQFHEGANETQTFRLNEQDIIDAVGEILAPAIPTSITTRLDWKTIWVLSLGAEYAADNGFSGRLGYSLGRSATPRSTLTPFMPPPQLAAGYYGGAGYSAERFQVDVSFGYSGGEGTRIRSSPESCTEPPLGSAPAGCAGRYSTQTVFFGVSAIYRSPAPRRAETAPEDDDYVF